MFRHFSLLLLLFCLIYHCGNPSTPVTGIKGGNITLTCELEVNETVLIELFSGLKDIDVCQTEECSGRVFNENNCDVIIKNLSFSDAGKYTLRVHYKKTSTVKDRMYLLHIHDDVTVKIGKPLKMHVLFSNAHKVEKHSSEGWVKVWERGHGVWNSRMNDTDGNLIINEFMASDAGSYRVLDADGDILVTVTITESSTGSMDRLDNTDKNKTDDAEQHKNWIVPLVVCSGILAVIVIAVIIWRHQSRGYRQAPEQNNQEPPEELENLRQHDEPAQEPEHLEELENLRQHDEPAQENPEPLEELENL